MMYYKIINERQVFNNGESLYIEEEDRWVSNPPEEMMLDYGWLPFIPPVIPPQPMNEPGYDEIVLAVKRMLSTDIEDLSDEDALNVAALYPTWSSMLGESVTAGTRVWDDGKLWKVLQPHTFQANWRPEDSPSLFVEVSIEEWPPIPEVISAENAYMTGDRCTWQGHRYICEMDNCVWNPDQLPSAWRRVD